MLIILRKAATLFRLVIAGLAGWGLLVPLSHCWPKKRGRVILIGQSGDRFLDNTKYLFLHLAGLGSDCLYLAGSAMIANTLREMGYCAVAGFSPAAIWNLFRAETVVVDGFELRFGMRFYLAHGSRKVQLWHGIPIKKINLQRRFSRPAKPGNLIGRAFWGFAGHFPRYDLLVSTSDFCTKRALKGAFRARQIVETGYPRNDVLFREPTPGDLTGSDAGTAAVLRGWKKCRDKLVLYAPTFRAHGGNAVDAGALNLSALNRFAAEHNLRIVVKTHVNEPNQAGVEGFERIINYSATADIYPFLNLFDLMVTDYSSMFFDFLLLDRPVVFFPYDYDNYIARERPLLFEYREMAPGPICKDQAELERALGNILNGRDSYRERREETSRLAFAFLDGHAAERVAGFLGVG